MSAALVVAARSTEFLPVNVAVFIHLMAWGLWLGSNIWTTFIAGGTVCVTLLSVLHAAYEQSSPRSS